LIVGKRSGSVKWRRNRFEAQRPLFNPAIETTRFDLDDRGTGIQFTFENHKVSIVIAKAFHLLSGYKNVIPLEQAVPEQKETRRKHRRCHGVGRNDDLKTPGTKRLCSVPDHAPILDDRKRREAIGRHIPGKRKQSPRMNVAVPEMIEYGDRDRSSGTDLGTRHQGIRDHTVGEVENPAAHLEEHPELMSVTYDKNDLGPCRV
jgi:hypothetical protein